MEETITQGKDVRLEPLTINNKAYFKISNSDEMRPFFMSIVSDSNHWMFISSNGGLTAGRKNAEYAIFPYYSDDKITEISDRYIELYENITGQPFEKANTDQILNRIEQNVSAFLATLK